jgi:hypothetical protein
MAKQIPSSPSTKKISEIYRRIKEGSLILQPDFQRKFVWTSEYKEEFIDTILQGLPFPEIYIAQTGIDIEKIMSREVIVDGQQRLSTIVQYIDEPEGTKEFGKLVPKYKDLEQETRNEILNYSVVFRDLGDIESGMIREVFRRINLTKFGLEQIEIQNAVYNGEFISCAKTILNAIEKEHIPIFSESELSRMADLHFILLLQSTVIADGYFSRDTEIEKYIIENNDEFQQSESVQENFIKLFELIKKLDLPEDSIWYRKSNFFTMFIELSKIDVRKPDVLKENLIAFENEVLNNRGKSRDTNDYSLYYSCMYTGTNNRTSRITRSELFVKYCINNVA